MLNEIIVKHITPLSFKPRMQMKKLTTLTFCFLPPSHSSFLLSFILSSFSLFLFFLSSISFVFTSFSVFIFFFSTALYFLFFFLGQKFWGNKRNPTNETCGKHNAERNSLRNYFRLKDKSIL